MKLKNLLKGYTYVSSLITEENFPKPEKIQTKNWKLIKMGKPATSEEVLAEIKRQGLRPANMWELATWAKENRYKILTHPWVVALQDKETLPQIYGVHRVPRVGCGSDGGFGFYLGVFELVWYGDDAFLCFCDSTLETSPLEDKSSLTLEKRVKALEDRVEKLLNVIKI